MNKVEKIKAEIEGRIKSYEKYCSGNPEYFKENYPEKYYAIAAYTDLYSFLDSLSDTEKDFSIKESVIPFGASDSELMEATYFIPQGYHAVIDGNKVIIKKGEEPVSNDLEEAATKYARKQLSNPDYPTYNDEYEMECAFEAGAQWQKANLWKDAQSDDLPEIDKEVIVLVKALPEHEDSLLKVSFAHRPPKYWMGKSISTGEITRYEPKRYDKGQWSKPNVVYWLDIELPKEEE